MISEVDEADDQFFSFLATLDDFRFDVERFAKIVPDEDAAFMATNGIAHRGQHAER